MDQVQDVLVTLPTENSSGKRVRSNPVRSTRGRKFSRDFESNSSTDSDLDLDPGSSDYEERQSPGKKRRASVAFSNRVPASNGATEPEPTRDESSEPTTSVFLESVSEHTHYQCPLGTDLSLSGISKVLADIFDVEETNQQITFLHAETVVTYSIGTLTPTQLTTTMLPEGGVVILNQLAASRISRSDKIRSWRVSDTFTEKSSIDSTDPAVQNRVRNRMARMLKMKPKHTALNLRTLARVSGISKAALSDFRRNTYKGNVAGIALAVHEALNDIETCPRKFGILTIPEKKVDEDGPIVKKHKKL